MKETDIQWHPGFVAAMNLELMENQDDLVFDKEYNLNTKPLEIDLLVIKKNASVQIQNEIGRIFRGYNIVEYKSPLQHLDIDTFFKVGAYASLYKSYGKAVDAIKEEDVTVSIIREAKSKGLFRYFKEHGVTVENPYHGIYYILGKVLFPTQIIVTRELDREAHMWLWSLSGKLEEQDMYRLLENVNKLKGKSDREYADSVLEVSVEANREIIEKWIGGGDMSKALLEIMEPYIEPLLLEREKQGRIEGAKEGRIEGVQLGRIEGTVESLREFGHSDMEIKSALMRNYHLSEEEAIAYL